MKVAFYKHKKTGLAGIFPWLIRTITRSPYSHCELVFHNGVAYSASIQDGGTRWKEIDFDPTHWDMVEVTDCNELKAVTFCNKEEGCGYDYPGVFRFLAPFIRQSKTRWFCSEVVTAALQAGGLLPNVKAWRVTPAKLYELLAGTPENIKN